MFERLTLAACDTQDRTRANYTVYRIIEQARQRSVYVGVCLQAHYPQVFVRHFTDDLRAPWHRHQVVRGAYQRPMAVWPFFPQVIENVRGFTALEAVAAQQYWWEYHGGRRLLKWQCQPPMPRSQFIVLRNEGCWDGYLKGFPNGWVPQV